MNKAYTYADDCPNCGEKDQHEAYKGARAGSSSWGHSYLCCSDACGRAFLNSPKHRAFELQRICRELAVLQEELKQWVDMEPADPQGGKDA